VVVAGFGAGPEAARLDEAAGWPLVAEPASGSWHGPNAVPAGRLAVQALGEWAQRVVIHGRPVLSRPVARLVQDPAVESVVVHPGGGPWFDLGGNARRVVAAAEPAAADPAGEKAERDWLDAWLGVGRDLGRRVAGWPFPNGSAVAAAVLAAASRAGETSGPLVVGSSSAIRDLGLAPPPARAGTRIAAMRGVAGIDGTIAFASGVHFAAAPDRVTRVLLGDLALAHDSGALLTPVMEKAPRLQIVVLQDGGGGIFESLEPAAVGPRELFERFFATPVRLDLACLAKSYGAAHATARSLAELDALLAAPPEGVSLIGVPLDRSHRRGLEEDAVELSRNGLVLPSNLS
jgi:2-succinyl-5-enolpyruvyl-6-hydroxy-3-cyclohexene-1-carboxylate synthase